VIRVLIADDQALVRAGFRMILDAEEDIDVVGEASDGNEAVAQAKRLDPDVVLMDIRMPELDGIEATKRVVADGGRRAARRRTAGRAPPCPRAHARRCGRWRSARRCRRSPARGARAPSARSPRSAPRRRA
jgi:hypothetical protein